MKFEEILPLMREGKKARLSSNQEGEYWICGSIGNPEIGIPIILTIVRMDNNDCAPRTTYDWGIARWMVMADDWEVHEI